MMNMHWNIIVFIVIELILLPIVIKQSKEPKGDYGFNLLTPLLIISMVAFALIWGGIFWW